jgi:hypothetical protein
MRTEWTALSDAKEVFEGLDRKTGELKWTGILSIFSWLGLRTPGRGRARPWRRLE